MCDNLWTPSAQFIWTKRLRYCVIVTIFSKKFVSRVWRRNDQSHNFERLSQSQIHISAQHHQSQNPVDSYALWQSNLNRQNRAERIRPVGQLTNQLTAKSQGVVQQKVGKFWTLSLKTQKIPPKATLAELQQPNFCHKNTLNYCILSILRLFL